jgi:membrane protease YdiL (CAAX protease family)
MQPPSADSLDVQLTLLLFAASIITWYWLFWRLAHRGYILLHQARRPVPWGPPAAMLAVLFVLIALSSAFPAAPAESASKNASPSEAIEQSTASLLVELVMIGTALALVVVFTKATAQDLGLPRGGLELAHDVTTGIMACLAAFAPVFGVLILIDYLQGGIEESHHPLVEMVLRTRDYFVMVMASIAAVVIAPICEEIAFRLLLQGWLEKWEDEKLGWREGASNESVQMSNDECRMTNEEQASRENRPLAAGHSSIPFPSGDPPRKGLAGLPYGWLPVVVSSFLFALAHVGYGWEPVPLFVLALILGNVYQRTHRIVPCMVAHALFNLVTVVKLWQMISLPQN